MALGLRPGISGPMRCSTSIVEGVPFTRPRRGLAFRHRGAATTAFVFKKSPARSPGRINLFPVSAVAYRRRRSSTREVRQGRREPCCSSRAGHTCVKEFGEGIGAVAKLKECRNGDLFLDYCEMAA